ncbi:MAG: serine hydrolase [Candidatus Acidiferrales bacterium]
MRTVLAVACLVLASSAAAWPQAPAAPTPGKEELPGELHSKLQRELGRVAAEFDGVMGIAVKDLSGGDAFTVNADMVFPQASSIKTPVLIELYRQAQTGTLKLEERVEVKKSLAAGGSGVLQNFGDGTASLALRDLAVLMIVLSDNTATNILIDRVGMEKVNGMLAHYGLRRTRLQRRMLDTEAQQAGRENLSTPLEMAGLLGLLHEGKILNAENTAAVMEILSYSKGGPLRRGVPGSVRLANKPGGLAGVSCDSGIVLLEGRPYAISVMTTFGPVGDAPSGEAAIGEVSRRVYEYFRRVAASNALGVRVR